MWLQYIFQNKFGLLTQLFTALGWTALAKINWTSPSWLFWGMLISYVYGSVGYFMLILLSGIEGIPQDIYESAKIDGANSWIKFWKITFPLLRNVIRTCITLWTVGAVNFFVWAKMFSTRINTKTITPVYFLYEKVFGAADSGSVLDIGAGAAVGVVVALLVLACYLIMNRVFKEEALEALCCFDICTARPDVLSLLGEHPAEIFYGASSDLKLERLYTFFYQECSRDFYFRGEQHDALELVYVDRGELHNLVGGVDILLRPQQMLLINRNIWHMQYADLPVSFLTVSFRAAVDSPCSSLCGQVLALTARQITLLRRMLDEHSSTDFAYDCVESLLKLLLADLIRCEKKRSFQPAAQLPSTSHAEQRIADQLVQIISSKAGEKITLQQLADAAHISTTYLHRIFRTQLGMTPGNYLAKIRIEESISSRNFPAAPTNGSPCKSSFSPGPSPTNMTSASRGPTPKTTLCRVCDNGQLVQDRQAA